MNQINDILKSSVYDIFASFGEGHFDGETVICPECGEPYQVWQHIAACDGVLPCYVECACSRQAHLEHQQRRLVRDRAEALEFSQLPSRYEGYTFEAWRGDKGTAYALGTRYCARAEELIGQGRGFTLRGDIRIGKTYLLSCVLNRLSNEGWRVFYMNHGDVLEALRPNSSGKKGDEKLMSRLKRAQLVILDDIGTERITEWGISKTYGIIDYLYRNNKPLLCGTNLTESQLNAYFTGDDDFNRITPRILEVSPLVSLQTQSQSETAQAMARAQISNLMA